VEVSGRTEDHACLTLCRLPAQPADEHFAERWKTEPDQTSETRLIADACAHTVINPPE